MSLAAALASLSELGFVRTPGGSMVRSGPLWNPMWGPLPDNPDLTANVGTLHRNQAFLDRLRDGTVPGEAELGRAPVLDHWIVGADDLDVFLLGSVTGHPKLGTSDLITTSSPRDRRRRRMGTHRVTLVPPRRPGVDREGGPMTRIRIMNETGHQVLFEAVDVTAKPWNAGQPTIGVPFTALLIH